MRVLITGITGFAGGHLAEFLTASGVSVFGCARSDTWPTELQHLAGSVTLTGCDLTQDNAWLPLLTQTRADAVYHLAALADPAACRRDPVAARQINVEATRALYETLRKLDRPIRVLYVSSSHVYGAAKREDLPLKETSPLCETGDVYSDTKRAADRLSLHYVREHRLPIVVVRPFHHVGPRRPANYAISGWAQQVAAIETGKQPPVVRVGNLESRRDFSDVRDVVRAYAAALEHGEPGEVFNVGSGVSRRAGDILEELLALARVPIRVDVDSRLLRANDVPEIVADVSRLRQYTHWQPRIDFSTTLRDTLEDWRRREGAIE